MSHPSGPHRAPDPGRVVDEDLPPKQLERLKEEAEKALKIRYLSESSDEIKTVSEGLELLKKSGKHLRNADVEPGAMRLHRIVFDAAAVFFDQLLADGQAQAGSV